MRVTNSMMINTFLTNLGKNATRLSKYQNQMQTGKKFSRPSDDPVAASYAVQFDTDIAKETQYLVNVEAAEEMLTATETALTSYNNVLGRVHELTVQASSTTMSASAREAITNELEQLREELISVANTTYNGRYLFSGYQTDEKLISDDGTYLIDVQDNEVINYQVGQANRMQVNVLGTEAFGPATEGGKPLAFRTIDNLITATKANNTDDIKGMLDEVSNLQDIVLKSVTDIGGRMNRLNLARSRITNNTNNLDEMRSLNEDVDIAEATTNFSMEKIVYQSALAAGAQIIQPTLLDFI